MADYELRPTGWALYVGLVNDRANFIVVGLRHGLAATGVQGTSVQELSVESDL